METVIVARSKVQNAIMRAAARPRSRCHSQESAERIREAFDLQHGVVLRAPYSEHFAVGRADHSAGGVDGACAGFQRPLKEVAERREAAEGTCG